ncbi:hypothetical protein P153DRAFT_297883 [Dothidotthia symphoricarpi CBS 119687]|uniref:DUF7730 domain-containing protein n=1 Tax=Dothidotthia symphoricarpi CBS 119687 TaxID=1392245 RepID=A0A6A6A4R1_9PLEO|nr:uncharacterized protein P153DRAFT_297883 [Dothidotthia symphoricarpi CBS 119687]KAF2126526.1 hypothetical protein P153DRAFT_297883 [Dothidotthia symphoricarpi CBS 119687]
MSQSTADEVTFASGRYSKRKRTQVVYCLEELEVDDSESDYETPQLKKRKATRTSRPLPKHKTFPFLELPAEIRNEIYHYVLADPSGINLVSVNKHKRRTVKRVTAKLMEDLRGYNGSVVINYKIKANTEEPAVLVPSLLAVNKQILHEGRSILYSNEFTFMDTSALYNLLVNLGPTGASLLKRIRLLGWGDGRGTKPYNHACFAVLVWATNLSKVSIDTHMGYHRSTKKVAERIYRDAFPWLEAVGMAQGKVDAAVDILDLSEDSYRFVSTNSDVEEVTKEIGDHLRTILEAQRKRVMATVVTKKRKSTAPTEL